MEGVPVAPAPLQQLWGLCHGSPSPSRPSSSSGLFLTPSSLTTPLHLAFLPLSSICFHRDTTRPCGEGDVRAVPEHSRAFRNFSRLFLTEPQVGGGGGRGGCSPPSPQNIPVSVLKEPSPASPWGSPQVGSPSPPPWLRDRRHFVLLFKPSAGVVLRGKQPRTLITTPLAPPLPKFPETTVIKL